MSKKEEVINALEESESNKLITSETIVYHGNENKVHRFSEIRPSFFTTDKEYAKGIHYLIQQEILSSPESNGELYIPEWFKFTTAWWSTGEITDTTYGYAMQFLISEKLVAEENWKIDIGMKTFIVVSKHPYIGNGRQNIASPLTFLLKIFVNCGMNVSMMYSKIKKYARKNVVECIQYGDKKY